MKNHFTQSAYHDINTNFIFHDKVAKIYLNYLIKGILNGGGKIQSIYNFAKKYNPNIKKTSGKHYFQKTSL